MKKVKTFNIVTFGCRVNQAESRMIGEKLVKRGFFHIDHFSKANLVVINTCAVTGKAEKEVRQTIRKIKKENPGCFLVVIGCWINKFKITRSTSFDKTQDKRLGQANETRQSDGQELGILENIDLVVGNEEKPRIGDLIEEEFTRIRARSFAGAQDDTKKVVNYSTAVYKDKYFESRKTFIKIQDGCDNFCSYCIVPYSRGKSVSRPAEEILAEIKEKVGQGIKEVVLTGIDIADYRFNSVSSRGSPTNAGRRGDLKRFKETSKLCQFSTDCHGPIKSDFAMTENLSNDLVRLLRLILAETEIEKISFGSINVNAFDEEFINFLASSCQSPVASRVMRYFHIPLQSGCNKTLRRMNRKYMIEEYEKVIKRLREKIPNVTVSTDIMVGFPGETEEEFEESLRNIGKIGFAKLHVFRYSMRQGTVAEKMEEKWGRVKDKIKKRRAKK